jgi:hypothetical protein
MIAENLLNFILRYAVGVKFLFNNDILIHDTIISAFFLFIWFCVFINSL